MKTKKSVYAENGIEYITKEQKIVTPVGTIRELLKKGNSKTGEKVLTWSMNTTTCKYQCEGCYGKRGCYNFADVKRSLANNTELARHHIDFLKRAIISQLSCVKPGTEIRIHAVGDFFSVEYVEMWKDIIRMFPELIFWTYTKVSEYENAFDEFKNANIVKSLVNGELNFGHCNHVMKLYSDLMEAGESVHICRCGVDDNQHCAGCHKCSDSEYVLFLEHSTDYKAENDPLFDEFKALVNNQ